MSKSPTALPLILGLTIGASFTALYNKPEIFTNLLSTLKTLLHSFQKPETQVNEDCPGVDDPNAGHSSACIGCPNQKICSSGTPAPPDPTNLEIKEKLKHVKKKILILSGKGGVGKSTISSQLAYALSQHKQVGLLDIDICGPSIPHLFKMSQAEVHKSAYGWNPISVNDNLSIMSIGFLLPHQDDAIIWRGPKKNGLIKQFLLDVNWGDLDFLLVDTPPGTSDEHLAITSYLKEAGIDGAVVVTSPQEVALMDVRKEINFCKKVGIPVLGVVENMSNGVFVASTGGAKAMCEKMEVPYLAQIDLCREISMAGERGDMVEEGAAREQFAHVAREVMRSLGM